MPVIPNSYFLDTPRDFFAQSVFMFLQVGDQGWEVDGQAKEFKRLATKKNHNTHHSLPDLGH